MLRAAHERGELDALFAHKIAESLEFRAWLLSRTKFAKLWPLARLMHVEQTAMKGAEAWWKGWSDARDAFETGVFLVFEIEHTNLRFALHIENMPPTAAFAEKQAESARDRATRMAHRDEFLNYDDFETVLLAPSAFIEGELRSRFFDRRIPYEAIAGFAPEFAPSERRAA